MKEKDREGGLILANGEIFKVFASLNKRRKRYALLRLRRCLFSTSENWALCRFEWITEEKG